MLSQVQKVAIRAHLGVPFAGTANAGRLYGWRFTWYNEDLEYRMNNMQPAEEQLLTGSILGSFKLQGNPTLGDTVQYGITDPVQGLIQVPYTVQASDLSTPPNTVNPSESSPLYSIALNSTTAILAAAAQYGYAAVGVMPADLFSPAYLPPYFAEVIISAPGVQPGQPFFSLSATGGSTTNLLVEQQATLSPIAAVLTNFVTGVQSPYSGYIALCDALRMNMTQTGLSLWLKKADVVDFRQNERSARKALYMEYVHQLEAVLGGRDYVQKFSGGGGGGGAVC